MKGGSERRFKYMTLSPQMKLRLDKIDALVEKGYLVKTNGDFPLPILISPKGKAVNTYLQGKYGDDSLPGFSWIAFFFPFVLATKIRDWKYFWFLGIVVFILSIIESIFNIDLTIVASFGIPLFYGSGYPFQRWLFVKSNKEEIVTFVSVLLGILLSVVALIPSFIIYGIFSQ